MNRREFLRSSLFSAGSLALTSVGGGALLSSCNSQEKEPVHVPGMIYRKLGRTGIEVSVVALGCEGYAKMTAEEVKTEFDYAISHGINFIDMYSPNPDLRDHVGAALKGRRNEFVIQGHIGSVWEKGQYLRTREIEKVKAGFEDQLKRLQTNYIDVGMIHFVDEQEDYDTVFNGEFIELVKQYRKEKKIRSIGLSTHSVEIAMQAAQSGLIDVLMFSLNPGYDMVFENQEITGVAPDRQALYEYCAKNDIALDVMKAFGGGNMLDDANSPFGKAFTPVQCMEYALTRPAVAAVMCGVHTREQLDADLAYLTATQDEKDFVSVLAGVSSSDWKGNCMYCTHCLPCPQRIDIANVNKYLNLAQAQEEVPETVQDHYNLLRAHGSDCNFCGQCEPRCPFGVKIMDNMRQATRVFGI